ncbi:MAG: T9SS type A sorting domain-containing protein, partial [Bacteroidetes bacterium]|nr:T9SS type A sorting domain-containing protein [Bacteroidota bacterium]
PPTPYITVTSPNSATTYYQGASTNISWTSGFLTAHYVAIDYTLDNGATWIQITDITEDDGSYAWTIPDTVSTQCLVRVSEQGNPSVFDVSNVNFTIAKPYIVITSPNGGETFEGCDSKTITWTRGGTGYYYRVQYSLDAGTTWTNISSSYYNTSSTVSFTWTPVPSLSSNQVLIRVNDANRLSTGDTSNAVFTIIPNTDIIISSPNGGESWEVGTSKTLSWVAATGVNHFRVYYSTDNGSTWISINSSVYATSLAWTVLDAVSNQCLIKVTEYTNTCIQDVSNAIFSITPPTPVISVTSPNSAVTWYQGNAQTISWTSAYLTSSFVNIEYSVDNGNTWATVIAATEDDGSYSWAIPDVVSTQCLVRVSEYGNPTVSDVSNVNFTIALPYIIITSPNGGETYEGCDSKTITWTRGGTGYYYRVQYSLDGGTTWTNISSSYYSTSSTVSLTWNPVPSLYSDQVLVRVNDANRLTTGDTSNAVFTLIPNTDIIITSPNGGESWEVGTSKTLSWVAATGVNHFRVYYSTDNGSTWISINSSVYATSLAWTVPDAVSSQCLIQVTEYTNTCIQDVSDAVFSITPPTPVITVTNPNSAVTLYQGNSQTISWTSAYLTSSFVQIEYSIDNGNTWTTVIAATENDGSYSWLVPDVVSTECLVRVSEYGNPTVSDVSNVNFTIALPYITITSPNGGETFEGCDSKTITWTRGGTGYYYRVQYSLDGGTTWANISSSYYNSSSTVTYTWNPVPSIFSNQVLVRVNDANRLTTGDTSNAVFTMIPNTDIIITAPNGGESWEVGTSKTLTWVAASGVNHFRVYYSTNNGSTWTSINSSVYSTSLAWTVPDAVSNQCLIQVTEYTNTCIQDVSDAVFNITPPTPVITVTNPNSAVTLYQGNSQTISWTSAYLTSSFVNIEYSIDNGNTWTTVIAATENDGSYSWLVPDVISTQCLVRVSEYGNPAVSDISNVTFSIAEPYITLINPDGGQDITGCDSYSIQWTRGGTGYYYKIELSKDNGTTWTTINSNYYSSSGSPTYSWTTVPDQPSTFCRVRVSDVSRPAVTDMSAQPFTISKNDDVVLTSPNGSENWQAGSSHSITWVAAPTSTRYSVYYSTDNGSTWTSLTTGTYSTSYNWTVPNNPGTQYRVKVVDYDNTCVYDMSDNPFTVTPGTPQLLSPNGGELRYIGSTYTITWTYQYFSGNFVKLEFSTNSGASWNVIESVTNNDGSYSWLIPNNASEYCLVRVSAYNDASVYDVSDAEFSIRPSIVLSTPNGDGGGELWRVCTVTSITWSANGASSYYNIEYSTNNGASWTTIQSNYYASGSSVSYDWTLPNTPSTQCLVRVTDKNYAVKTDMSDATFTISPSISLTSPNGGESLTGGSTHEITWVAAGVSNYFNIDYSTNGGSSWTNVVYNQNITTNTYTWNVPSVVSTNCLIRVTDNVNTCKTDQSEQVFAIGATAPQIAITAPNGGETLNSCATTNITWTASAVSDNYDIFYSTNAGSSWTVIVSNTNIPSKSYTWTIPNVTSSNCLVKVRDSGSQNIYDVSNAIFSIQGAQAIAGADEEICNGSSVQLNASGGATYNWTPTNNLSNPAISNPIANPAVSTTYTLNITNSFGCTASDAIAVIVHPIPAAPVASSNSPVDLGATLYLTASTINGGSYFWSGPNGFTANQQNPSISNASAVIAGKYYVYAVVDGCQGPQDSVTVVVSGVPATANVVGSVYTENAATVSGVTVALNGPTTGSEFTMSDGLFDFSANWGGNYSITPSKNNDVAVTNGVSTLDIILMQRHILGVQSLGTPYRIIAADVNRSSSVTTLDIVLTRSLILQNTTSFPGGDLWSFVNSDFVFANPLSPFPYEASRSYSSIESATDQDFVAVKLGDVNDSWNSAVAKADFGELLIETPSIIATPGSSISIPFIARNFDQISGYQFTLNWDPALIELSGATYIAVQGFFGNQTTGVGSISTLWSTENPDGQTLSDSDTLFVLDFNVLQPIVETQINITSDITPAEAYRSTLEVLDVVGDMGSISAENLTNVFDASGENGCLLSNNPNPFSGETRIRYCVEEAGVVSLKVTNILGEVVNVYTFSATAGQNEFTLNPINSAGQILAAGVYFIQLNSGTKLESRKIVVR